MPSDQISSSVFVGRENELARFKRLLSPECPATIFNIHTNGEGGVGKTRLLLRMQEYCASVPEQVVAASDIIDFYHTESRSRLGVLEQIVANLGRDQFLQYTPLSSEYFNSTDVSAREDLLPQLEEAFQRDYAAFAAHIAAEKRVIALFFDTYEFIQGAEITGKERKKAPSSGFSRWIETQLFPALAQQTRLIVSGRFPLSAVPPDTIGFEELHLRHFSLEETDTFWKRCFGMTSEAQLREKIPRHLLKSIHALADGRPVLLALFADWLNYAHNPLSPEKLLAEIAQRAGQTPDVVSCEQKALFEKALIERIAACTQSEARAVIYLAVAYRRMTPEMFQFLTDLPLQECRDILLRHLRPLSFIKHKKGDIVLLHDEMRRLVVQHWWEIQDASHEDRRAIARDLLEYYQERLLNNEELSETDREIYTSELLEYAFLADPKNGLTRFCDEFDLALEDGRYDYCDLLLREAEVYHRETPQKLPFPDALEIPLRRIRYYTKTDRNYGKSLHTARKIIETYQNRSTWEQSAVRGHVLTERAIAEFSLGDFSQAIASFESARKVFYLVGADSAVHWINNWIGYTYYRQGNFKDAEDYLTRSRNEFQDILDERDRLDAHERRQLIQGIQVAVGNSAMVYSYTGKFDKAVRKAEIALNIVRNLPYNRVEIARTRNTAGKVFAFAGHAIDAHHHLTEAQNLLHGIGNRQILGRVKTNLAFLHYRVNEFAYLLEYYRAEELQKFLRYIPTERINQARAQVQEAIETLSRAPVIKKELADAYYALGELYIVAPTADHWEQAEQAFLQSLRWGQESQFRYRVVDTLESLVTLYYLWNGVSDVSEALWNENQRKLNVYRQEMERYTPDEYPNLFGKYRVTLGDKAFDEALAILRAGEIELLDSANAFLAEAFDHYTNAAMLMQQFNETRYYLILRLFYNRLNTLLEANRNQHLLDEVFHFLDMQREAWQTQISEVAPIFYYVALRIQTEETLQTHLQDLQKTIKRHLDHGNFGLALVLNDCLIGLCISLLQFDAQNETYHERLVLRLHVQYKLYRILGDEYQSRRFLRLARRRQQAIRDPHLKEALDGWADAGEGTLKYRRGEYGKLVEFYLADELETARRKFDAEFPDERQEALELLQRGEEKLQRSVLYWEEHSPDDERITTYRRHLGETQFRIAELLMLHERFSEHSFQKRVLRQLKQAIEHVANSNAFYRHDDAVQSYLNALYLSGNADDPDYAQEWRAYELLLEDKIASGRQIYPSIMAKFRITQGDALFSRYFIRRETVRGEYGYVPRVSEGDTRILRTILRYYVEACNFMAQHGSIDFATAVRVLQRRIELIAEKQSLKEIRRGLRNVWSDQPSLRDKSDILNTLVQFAKIRSLILEDETIR